MRTRKSAPTLAERQRRHQIIDLLAGRLARMPEDTDVSAPGDGETGAGQSCQRVTAGSLKVSRFRGSAALALAALPWLRSVSRYLWSRMGSKA
jgi:hypothetical protein